MSTLAADRLARFRAALEQCDVDAFVAASPANVAYAVGYRSVSDQLFRGHQMASVVTPEQALLVVPAADTGPAVDAGVAEDALVAYGRFYFASAANHRAARLSDQHPDLASALVTAVGACGVATGRVGVDVAGLGPHWPAVQAALSGADLVDVSDVLVRARARKLPEEVDRLRRAARLAETGIDAALAAARAGSTERDLARVVAGVMLEGGGRPGFVVVTAGERSALGDAEPSDRPAQVGDLIRFDVGCTVDGYWSDMARTAVVGEPDEVQAARYRALLRGEQAQLDAVRPGVTAARLFEIAVNAVEGAGLSPYRRHHCGHGIGTDVYEPPIVAPGHDVALEPGMTFSLETPYYELGWGGMMVEDTILVTEDGHERLTISDRQLRVVRP